MPRAKKWSTGKVGNPYADHSERSNPNTRGISTDGIPGIEGYIEEDLVVASADNRPIENLAQNDQVLEQNLASIASEVDYGILAGKDNEFKIEVLQKGSYLNPEDESKTMEVTPLRIKSGQAVVDGQVTSIGSQKIIYFLKDDGSYIFPDYDEHEGKIVIPITDDLYSGSYKAVYDIEAEGLPLNFENYEIEITNKYDVQESRSTYFKMYRDWEDIIPYAPDAEELSSPLNFIYDGNYGRESDGIWLEGGDIDNIKISDVVVTKDIEVVDKKLNNFIKTDAGYEQYIVTDGIFFDNIPWKTETAEDRDVQDTYVDNGGSIYFIYTHKEPSESLYYLPSGSTQVTNIPMSNTEHQNITRVVELDGTLYLLGTNGYFRTYDVVNKPDNLDNIYDQFTDSVEEFVDVEIWEGRIWIATDKNLYYSESYELSQDSVFGLIDISDQLDDKTETTGLVNRINLLHPASGNFFADSSLKTNIKNIIKNSSFEKGGIGESPNFWTGGVLSTSGSFIGNYKALVSEGNSIEQDVELEIGKVYTLSMYVKTIADTTELNIKLNDVDNISTLTANNEWTRIEFQYTATTTLLNINVSSSMGILQVDAVQLELGEVANQFVQGFEYLIIGFDKNENDNHNPPFAIIDSKRLNEVNYNTGYYGNISSINDITSKENNELVFVDNTNIYSMILLNDEDEYNRITINNITKNNQELNLDTRIDRLNTIESFNDRLFFGGSILNKSISFTLNDSSSDRKIEILDINSPELSEQTDGSVSYTNLYDILGNYKIVTANNGTGLKVEFDRTEALYESRSNEVEIGFYKPGGVYSLAFRIDDNEAIIISIQAPSLFEGPISIEDIYDNIFAKNVSSDIEFNLEYSNTKVDGLYSIGKNKITRHIRGNIQRIYKQTNPLDNGHYDKGIYVVLEGAILHSKYDPNIKKSDGVYVNKPDIVGTVANIIDLPLTADYGNTYHVQDFGYYKWNGTIWENTGYLYHWDLNETEHKVREFKNKYNQSVTFEDSSQNKNWTQLPISEGYKLTAGSLRVKTNIETEIGFSENEDYFVDYENGRIIRTTVSNCLKDSEFSFVDSNDNYWNKYLSNNTTGNKTLYLEPKIDSYLSSIGETTITDNYASTYVDANSSSDAFIYQISTLDSLNIGDTYTFSVKIKTNKIRTGNLTISELVNDISSFDVRNDFTSVAYTISEDEEIPGDSYNEWHTYSVSHTVTDDTSNFLRVEIEYHVDGLLSEQIFIKEAQLERNQIMTPFVKEYIASRIDAGITTYVDFTQEKSLIDGVDYTFDTSNRKIVYSGVYDDDTELFLDYKYKKIFNPYLFETSIPLFDVNYDEKDDFFLFLYSGRVWAINFVLALISQDEENPLVIDYKYHAPRVDKIKIRSNPDKYGNYAYVVKGLADDINPYGPYDNGTDGVKYTTGVLSRDNIVDTDSNAMLYEINVIDTSYENNDIYDRRIFVNSADHKYYNISLYAQTAGYFPFLKDFMSTGGMNPLNRLYNSKIVDIIKNFKITQLEEIGATSSNYQLALRNKIEYPSTSNSIFVDVTSGDDGYAGTHGFPLKTIQAALNKIKNEEASPFIIVKSEGLITEDIDIDIAVSEIRIIASTYARWTGNIQNKTPLVLQGFQFERHNIYVVENIKFYYCTFMNSTVSNYIPTEIVFSNCTVDGGHNKFLFVKNTIFPSPFLHPYQRNVSASDNIEGSPESVATTDTESIHPNVSSYHNNITGNPSGYYTFYRCLITGLKDDIINYDLTNDEPWISEFKFEKCTIVDNANLFVTSKSSQSISYNECIIKGNSDTRGEETKYFDSQSSINIQNSYIDMDKSADGYTLNFNPNGSVFGRETCVDGLETEAGFISTQVDFENYRLRSEAQGYLSDSICIGRAADGRDIGCYDELRERLDVEVPKKLKSNFAYLDEGVHYPIVLNSEKITFTLEFKPASTYYSPAVLFDTRSHEDDKDYILVVYNNNYGDSVADIDPDPEIPVTEPYTFKVIVVNEKSRYAVVSPINMYSDADFQVWNKLSFTINYEKTFNEKANFDEKDRYQNIITLFHNEELAVESFLKNDMSYDEHNNLLEGLNNGSNSWNYNNISSFITVGSSFDQQYVLTGYYSEMRIDNKYINRKELEAWNKKVVPFNDPVTYLDQNNLARTFESSTVNDIWTLKTKYDVGAKGHSLNENTNKRFTYDNGEFTWALTNSTTNYLLNADFSSSLFVQVTTDEPPNNDTQNLFPVNLDHTMTIRTVGGNDFDNTGVVIDFTDGGSSFTSHGEINEFIQSVLDKPENVLSEIKVTKLKDNRFKVSSDNYMATKVEVLFENAGDAEEFGFRSENGGLSDDGTYTVENILSARLVSNTRNTESIEVMAGVTKELKAEHKVWPVEDVEHTRLSPISLGISRTVTSNNDPDYNYNNPDKYIKLVTHRKDIGSVLNLYDESIDEPIEYTYSMYVYKKDNEFNKDEIKMFTDGGSALDENNDHIDGNYQEFDTIENIYGYWWLLQKSIRITDDQTPDIGIVVLGELEFYIDAVQLEKSTFASPFVVDGDSSEGIIELDKSLLSDDKGVVFFRFKPMFRYNTSRKHILFESLGSMIDESGDVATNHTFGKDIADPNKGFKIWYEYDEETKKGKIQFRTSVIEADYVLDEESGEMVEPTPDEASWEIIVLEQFWNQWHTAVISYDFTTRRFVYFFDYFKNTVDVTIIPYKFFTNASIGKDAILCIDENGEPEFPLDSRSSDILVKDVLITNYSTSDTEIQNWINSNEFYKETLFTTLLETYQDDMYGVIETIEGITTDTFSIEKDITKLTSKVSVLEDFIDGDVDLTYVKVTQDELKNIIYNDTHGILTSIEVLDSVRVIQSENITLNKTAISDNTTSITANLNSIAKENSDRIESINRLIERLNATTLGEGASTISIHDPDNRFSATNVEFALLELEARIQVNEDEIDVAQADIIAINEDLGLMQGTDWNDSKAINDGFNIVSLRVDTNQQRIDIDTVVSDLAAEVVNRTDADDALNVSLTNLITTNIDDVSGVGRTTETIKSNADNIAVGVTGLSDVNIRVDGVDNDIIAIQGEVWDSTMNLVSHDERLDSAEGRLDTNEAGIALNVIDISDLNAGIVELTNSLSQEVIDRTAADAAAINSLSASTGAGLIGIADGSESFTATTVEGALQEIDGKLTTLAGSLNWQESVATFADLPTENNNLNDVRIVQDDGDGKRAQYVYNNTEWIKVSDVDWGDSSGVVYNNTDSGLESTDVKSALDELYVRSASPNSSEKVVASEEWISDTDGHYIDIVHDLGTFNIAIRAVDSSGFEIGVDEYERLNENVVRVKVVNAIEVSFTIFGAHNSYSKIVGSWTASGGMYVKDIIHSFNTQNIMTSIFNITTGERIGVDEIETLDDNAIRIMTADNSEVYNVFVLNKTSNATTKDIEYWVAKDGMYETMLPLALDYDAVYSFYDPATSRTVEVDSVKFEGGLLKIRRSENTLLRMVVLK